MKFSRVCSISFSLSLYLSATHHVAVLKNCRSPKYINFQPIRMWRNAVCLQRSGATLSIPMTITETKNYPRKPRKCFHNSLSRAFPQQQLLDRNFQWITRDEFRGKKFEFQKWLNYEVKRVNLSQFSGARWKRNNNRFASPLRLQSLHKKKPIHPISFNWWSLLSVGTWRKLCPPGHISFSNFPLH